MTDTPANNPPDIRTDIPALLEDVVRWRSDGSHGWQNGVFTTMGWWLSDVCWEEAHAAASHDDLLFLMQHLREIYLWPEKFEIKAGEIKEE